MGTQLSCYMRRRQQEDDSGKILTWPAHFGTNHLALSIRFVMLVDVSLDPSSTSSSQPAGSQEDPFLHSPSHTDTNDMKHPLTLRGLARTTIQLLTSPFGSN